MRIKREMLHQIKQVSSETYEKTENTVYRGLGKNNEARNKRGFCRSFLKTTQKFKKWSIKHSLLF
jgi:hypothetical protein